MAIRSPSDRSPQAQVFKRLGGLNGAVIPTAVTPASTPTVGRSYTNGSGNVLRLVGMLWHDGRGVTLRYCNGSSITDKLDQMSSLVDDNATIVAAYTYLGLSTFVQNDSAGIGTVDEDRNLRGQVETDVAPVYLIIQLEGGTRKEGC